LYVGERIQVQDFKAWREGGTGIDSQSRTQPLELPFLLEGGTPNSAGIVGLGEGIRFIQEKTVAVIRQHEIKLVQKLIDGLSKLDRVTLYGSRKAEDGVAAVLFNIKGIEPADVGSILDQSFQIAVRSGLHCAPLIHQKLGTSPMGGVRMSPGFFTTSEEIDLALSAVGEIVSQA
jgi:selenocysteine lyase/cysteine desulfurase